MDSFSKHGTFQSSLQNDNDADWAGADDPAVNRRREVAKAAEKEELDRKLDIALEDTFPASDPISIAQPPQSPYDKPKF